SPSTSRWRTSGCVTRCSRNSSVAVSSHCRSSRNSASGCSGLENTPRKRRNTIWKRFCASCGGRSGTGGCLPMMNSSSGMRLTINCPFGSTASLSALRHWSNSASLLTVELAPREKSTRRYKGLVQFVHHGGFADAGVTGYEHDFRRTARHDPVEGGQQRFDLGLPPIEFFRYEQPV